MRTFADYESLLERLVGRSTRAGRSINHKNALEVTAALACVRVLANGVAQVPWQLLREGQREPARDHPLYRVLYRRPNRWQTSFEYREQVTMHLALCGQHISYKNIVFGQLEELIPFEPQDVTVKRDAAGGMRYTVRAKDGSTQEYGAEVIWHVRGPSWDGVCGLEPVRLAREALGLALATEEQHAGLFARGLSASGTYSVQGKLTEQQHQALTKWIEQHYAGADNFGKPLILDNGATWLPRTLSGVDAQHLETRRFQIEEVCRAFGVNPIMIGHSGDKAATYASAEQMFLAHLVHTLSPWYERIEQSADINLLSEQDQKAGYYTNFVEDGLLRASIEATANTLDKLVNGGLMKPNEARAKLHLPPDEDKASDKLRIPANIVGKAPAQEGTTP